MAATIYSCTFSAPGNPDFRQYAPLARARVCFARAGDLAFISFEARQYIRFHDLGGGNWSSPPIYDDEGQIVGRVSYNGVIWPPGEWHRDMKPIYEPKGGA